MIKVLSTKVDPISENELISRIVNRADARKGLYVTYLTAWTLVQCEQKPEFKQLIGSSDLCYADGYGVVLSLLLTRGISVKKVTANSFYPDLFSELANKGLIVALIGGGHGVSIAAKEKIKKIAPNIKITTCSSGYLSSSEEKKLIDKLIAEQPHLIIVGMGQPKQEDWVTRNRQLLPHTVFYCVGALLDLISGKDPAPHPLIRQLGFEWFWRLVHKPKRLWKRYVYGIPRLGLYIIKYSFLGFFQNIGSNNDAR